MSSTYAEGRWNCDGIWTPTSAVNGGSRRNCFKWFGSIQSHAFVYTLLSTFCVASICLVVAEQVALDYQIEKTSAQIANINALIPQFEKRYYALSLRMSCGKPYNIGIPDFCRIPCS